MKHMRYWLSSKRRQMAKLHDLQRQLQEAWERGYRWEHGYYTERALHKEAVAQLHRVARERDKERELRLAAEDALIDYHLDKREDVELEQAAEELRDVYLEQLANEEE